MTDMNDDGARRPRDLTPAETIELRGTAMTWARATVRIRALHELYWLSPVSEELALDLRRAKRDYDSAHIHLIEMIEVLAERIAGLTVQGNITNEGEPK